MKPDDCLISPVAGPYIGEWVGRSIGGGGAVREKQNARQGTEESQ
jgi:hypothetical protein